MKAITYNGKTFKGTKGSKVVYTKNLRGLDFGTEGVLETLYGYLGWGIIIYPQNKGTNKVYAHSANIKHIKVLESN